MNDYTRPACGNVNGVPVFVDTLGDVEREQRQTYSGISVALSGINSFVSPVMFIRFVGNKYIGLLKVSGGTKILDLGTQDGVYLRYLKHLHPCLKDDNLHGVDITLPGLVLGKQANPGIKFAAASAYDLPFSDGYFDVVLINGILEHLDRPLDAIKEVSRVLKPGGQFISYLAVKDYGLSFHWITNDLLRIRRMIEESTVAIGHDYDHVIQPLVFYRKAYLASGLEITKEERVNILIRPFLDYLISKMATPAPSGTGTANTEPAGPPRRSILSRIMGVADAVLSIERFLFRGGVSYLNYGRKMAM